MFSSECIPTCNHSKSVKKFKQNRICPSRSNQFTRLFKILFAYIVVFPTKDIKHLRICPPFRTALFLIKKTWRRDEAPPRAQGEKKLHVGVVRRELIALGQRAAPSERAPQTRRSGSLLQPLNRSFLRWSLQGDPGHHQKAQP